MTQFIFTLLGSVAGIIIWTRVAPHLNKYSEHCDELFISPDISTIGKKCKSNCAFYKIKI